MRRSCINTLTFQRLMLMGRTDRFPFAAPFCRLPSACHFRESSRAYLPRQRNSAAVSIWHIYRILYGRGRKICLSLARWSWLCFESPGQGRGLYLLTLKKEALRAKKLTIKIILALRMKLWPARILATLLSAVAQELALSLQNRGVCRCWRQIGPLAKAAYPSECL